MSLPNLMPVIRALAGGAGLVVIARDIRRRIRRVSESLDDPFRSREGQQGSFRAFEGMRLVSVSVATILAVIFIMAAIATPGAPAVQLLFGATVISFGVYLVTSFLAGFAEGRSNRAANEEGKRAKELKMGNAVPQDHHAAVTDKHARDPSHNPSGRVNGPDRFSLDKH